MEGTPCCLGEEPAADGPVFLHGMFRTGSTFLFGRFRRNERFRCFFEPLNEGLFRLDDRMLARFSGAEAARRMRHEELEQPYYEEYRHLRRWWGGVGGYRVRFAYHGFFSERDADLVDYLRRLVLMAAQEGRHAMLKLVRSYGRLGLLRREFPGRHLYLLRNPHDQWQSYMRAGRPYWMAMTCVIAALRPGSEWSLSPRLSRPLPHFLRWWRVFGPLSAAPMLRVGRRFLRGLPAADAYRIFLREWGLARQAATRHCQQLVDMDRLSAESPYREDLEEQFGLSLAGCRIGRHEAYSLALAQMDEIEAEEREAMR